MTLADRIRPFMKTSISDRNLTYVPKRILLGWVAEAEELEELRQRALHLESVCKQAQRDIALLIEKSEEAATYIQALEVELGSQK
jgi:hypothetical protein